MTGLIIRTAEQQAVAESVERMRQAIEGRSRTMSGESNARLKAFNDEVLGRASQLIADMGQTFELFLRRIVSELDQFKINLLLIGWAGIRFEETKWLTDGQLQMRFSVGRPQPPDPELFHAVVDPYVDDVVGDFDLPAEFQAELGGFLRGLMLQFAVIQKHEQSFDLRSVRFEDFRWVEFDTLRCFIRNSRGLVTPRDIGWE